MSFPDRVELYMSKWKTLGFLVMALLFVWSGIYIMFESNWAAGLLTVLFFGFATLVFVVMLFRPTGIILANEGITFRGLRSDRTYPWAGITNIKVGKMPGSGIFCPKRVWFNLDESALGPTERKFAILTGGRGMLGSNFGYDVEDLAGMVRAFQARALQQTSAKADTL